MRERVGEHVQGLGPFNLQNAPVSVMVEALQLSGIQSWFIQEEQQLRDWHCTAWEARRLLLSDVQNEVRYKIVRS
jgi:hypothetical protein